VPLDRPVHLFTGDRGAALDSPHIVGGFQGDFAPAIRATKRVFDPPFVFAEIDLSWPATRRELGDTLLTERLEARHAAGPRKKLMSVAEILQHRWRLPQVNEDFFSD
jgi:hypothetical protein